MHKKTRNNKVYSPEFKTMVIETIQKEHLGLFETIKRFELSSNPHNAKHMVRNWERIYLEEGAAGLMEERRGRSSKGKRDGKRPTA